MNETTNTTAVTNEPKKKAPKKKAPKRSPFSQNALFCENFDPEKVVREKAGKNKPFEMLYHNGNPCMGKIEDKALSIFIPQLYIPAEGHRAWLRAVYPEYSIVEEYIRVSDTRGYSNENEHPYVICKVKIFRSPEDNAPFGAIGYSWYNANRSMQTQANFARADALRRALVNQGFGDGLNWDYLKEQQKTYIVNADGHFDEYNGPIYSNGVCIREGKADSAGEVATLMGVVCEPEHDIVDFIEPHHVNPENNISQQDITEDAAPPVQTVIPQQDSRESKVMQILNMHNSKNAGAKDD